MTYNILTILFLVFLEGLLSFDNALALAALVKELPSREMQKKALTYGMVGAFAFRALALLFLTTLMKSMIIKVLGGIYLIWLALHNLRASDQEEETEAVSPFDQFWRIIVIVELTDMVFSIDSIVAAVGVSNTWWVVFTGGVLGIIMMRIAATFFIKLMDKFPKLERSAFLLVLIVGVKLVLESLMPEEMNFHSFTSFWFWMFWSLMGYALLSGFNKEKVLVNK